MGSAVLDFEAATDRVEAARAEGDPVEIQRCLDAVDVAMAILYVFDSKMDTWLYLSTSLDGPSSPRSASRGSHSGKEV